MITLNIEPVTVEIMHPETATNQPTNQLTHSFTP